MHTIDHFSINYVGLKSGNISGLSGKSFNGLQKQTNKRKTQQEQANKQLNQLCSSFDMEFKNKPDPKLKFVVALDTYTSEVVLI